MAEETLELLDFLQSQLVKTQDRATKSERALLELKLEVFNNAMNDLKASAKRDLLIKQEVYRDFAGKVSQAQRDYESTIRDIEREVATNKEIYSLYFNALNEGLTMEELPLSMVDKPISEVESFIDVCVIKKKEEEKQLNQPWSVLRDLYVPNPGITSEVGSPIKHEDREAEMLKPGPTMSSPSKVAHYPGMNNITTMKEESKFTSISSAGKTEDQSTITVNKETRNYADGSGEVEKEKLLGVSAVEEESANWNKEPYSLLVDRLGKQFKNKIGKTLAVKTLGKAAEEVGDLKKLDDVYARAVQICQIILQPEKTTPETNPAPVPAPTQAVKALRSSIRLPRMCRFFVTYHTCRFGDNCIYAHTDEELQAFMQTNGDNDQRPYHPQNMFVSHMEPCNNQDCPQKLKYLKKLTEMCPQLERGLPCRNQNCFYAHQKQELKPMPKWEMCERSFNRRCKFQQEPEKCVYAHTEAELRERPVDAMQLTGNRTSSPRYTQDENREVGHCFICSQYLYPPQRPPTLRCGHDDFHQECLNDWKQRLNTNCPRCGVVM